MAIGSRIAAGLVLAGALIGFAGFTAYSKKLGPGAGIRHDLL